MDREVTKPRRIQIAQSSFQFGFVILYLDTYIFYLD